MTMHVNGKQLKLNCRVVNQNFNSLDSTLKAHLFPEFFYHLHACWCTFNGKCIFHKNLLTIHNLENLLLDFLRD